MKSSTLPVLLLAIATTWAPPTSAQNHDDYVASSIAHENAVHPHGPGADVSVETGNLKYKVRVVLPGSVRPVSEANSKLFSSWRATGGLKLEHEVLVQEGTVSYWMLIPEPSLPYFRKEVKPGASYDLYITRLGSVSSESVYLINSLVAVGPERPRVYPLADVAISLQRARPCPGYTVTIHGDGRVVYEGWGRCVGTIAHREWKIDRKRVVDLLDHMYQIRFFGMEDEYGTRDGVIVKDGVVEIQQLTLVPPEGPVITIKIGDYEKRVGNYGFAPQDLDALSPMIDEVAETAKWGN